MLLSDYSNWRLSQAVTVGILVFGLSGEAIPHANLAEVNNLPNNASEQVLRIRTESVHDWPLQSVSRGSMFTKVATGKQVALAGAKQEAAAKKTEKSDKSRKSGKSKKSGKNKAPGKSKKSEESTEGA